MKKVCWPYFDPDFDNLPERIYGPACRVSIDNETLEDCTLVKVDSVNKQGLLLEVIQALTDMNLTITKCFISSDAEWFMDVFHVKNENGNKLTNQNVINYIQQAIGTTTGPPDSTRANAYANNIFESENHSGHTTIEMTGTDRPGLFSEISAALADLHCNIVEAHAWTHNARLACVAQISDKSTDAPIDDPHRLTTIEDHLITVLRATTAVSPCGKEANNQEVKTTGFLGGDYQGTMTNVERRLHQLMLSIRDFDGPNLRSASSPRTPFGWDSEEECRKTAVWIESCEEKGYSMVSLESKDRPRLLFDTVCTLTDMQYVIFHASTHCHEGCAFQEYFIRHVDGNALCTESEKERVIKCLEAAIERRVSEGIRLELSADDRMGLLSDITRVLRENGLAVVRADVATQGEKAINAFYVRGISGNEVVPDMHFVESMKKELMGPSHINLQVKNERHLRSPSSTEKSRYFANIGDILKSQIGRLSFSRIK
ncbi:ACT domain-containing protein ACR2 [Argentina anserina]|uniref:ACT domain-containing protein ACR2 n=1 Tax=Argentina anserina TaxID=57926 RepID=UPI0021763D68|nr:ACT domain-containing protein ACR2 [Potentilla anserina]